MRENLSFCHSDVFTQVNSSMFTRLWKHPANAVFHHTTKAKMSSGAPAKKISFGPFEVTSQVSPMTIHGKRNPTKHNHH